MNHPPPGDLHSRKVLVYDVVAGTRFFRSHRTGYGPIHFGTVPRFRWDAPSGEYGVLYLALDEYAAFMESIGRNALRSRLVPKGDLLDRGLSTVFVKRQLRLINLFDSGGLTRAGAEGSLTSGAGYKNSQRWSRALRLHPERPDGILYGARHDPARRAAALYDHCRDALTAGPCRRWADSRVLLGAILDHYEFGTDL